MESAAVAAAMSISSDTSDGCTPENDRVDRDDRKESEESIVISIILVSSELSVICVCVAVYV